MKDRIRKLLIAGYKASDIAGVVGCTPAYISQLMADEEFKASVQAGFVEAAAEADEEVHLETRYQKLKHKIMNNIEESLPNAELPQLIRALEVVDKVEDNTKKRRNPVLSNPSPNIGSIHITNIALPAHALAAPRPVIEMNAQAEILSINNKPLAPMSADGVKNIFAQLQARKEQGQKLIAEL